VVEPDGKLGVDELRPSRPYFYVEGGEAVVFGFTVVSDIYWSAFTLYVNGVAVSTTKPTADGQWLQYTFTLKPGTNNITLYITYSAWLVIVIDDVNFGLPLSSSSYSFAYTVTQGRLSATLSFPYCPTFTAYASGTVNNTRVVSYVVTNTNATYSAKLVYLGRRQASH